MTDIRIKRGAALVLTFACAKADGTAFDLTTVTLSGMVRDSRDNLLGTLSFAFGDAGTMTATVVNTAAWPEGLHKADIAFTSVASGLVVLSETFPIYVDRPVTFTLPDEPAPNPVTGQGYGS